MSAMTKIKVLEDEKHSLKLVFTGLRLENVALKMSLKKR